MTERIRHKEHHFSNICYLGEVAVSITACVQNGRPVFQKSETVATFTDILCNAVTLNDCIVPVYCFMPEHLHMIVQGLSEASDVNRAVKRFKQRTGYWFSKHSQAVWQKNFHDHIIRRDGSLANHVWYIVNNPVRRGLVKTWGDYPYTGSIGLDLKELLSDILTI